MGRAFQRFLEQLGDVGLLTRDCVRQALRRPFEIQLLIEQLDSVGVRSLNVVNLTAIFTGMVLALQMGQFLGRFGATIYISRIMGLSLFREMGPVLTALMIGARVGAGITAELGSMKVTEQIDAMRAMAASPIRKLVVPRLVATLVMLPSLTVLGGAIGVLGGLLVAVFQLKLPAAVYNRNALQYLTLSDVVSGVGKSFFFAYFITIIACDNGLRATGGADGVGRATTRTVVTAAILVLVSDYFLTKLFILLS
jgi:phospholipid/cholesterol/gamma-HCH transport system permease protein